MIPLSAESVNRMTQRSGLSLQQLLNDRNLALQPCDSNDSTSNSSQMDEDVSNSSLGNPPPLQSIDGNLKNQLEPNSSGCLIIYIYSDAPPIDSDSISSARTRAMALERSARGTSVEQADRNDLVGGTNANDNLLKDVTAAADICRCNPCRCDPLLNDCSVSCNPVVEPESQPSTSSSSGGVKPGGCGCACGSKKRENKVETRPPDRGCGCSRPSQESSQEPAPPVQLCQSQDSSPVCSPLSDPDPCCIVVCLKHLKRQYLQDSRPHPCCVWSRGC